MATRERIRERISGPPSEETLRRREAEGWRLVAVEWERETEAADSPDDWRQAPYGLRAPDGSVALEESPSEREALHVILGMVIDDRNSLTEVAEELNRRGLTTRGGAAWSPSAVFNLMPRLVEVAPQIFGSADWSRTRQELSTPH